MIEINDSQNLSFFFLWIIQNKQQVIINVVLFAVNYQAENNKNSTCHLFWMS